MRLIGEKNSTEQKALLQYESNRTSLVQLHWKSVRMDGPVWMRRGSFVLREGRFGSDVRLGRSLLTCLWLLARLARTRPSTLNFLLTVQYLLDCTGVVITVATQGSPTFVST
jgi:hypothetical protein